MKKMDFINALKHNYSEAKKNWNYRHDKKAKQFIKTHDCPDLTKAEKEEIDRYWAAYHIKFKNYDFHRMYYAVTGIHDPRFLPSPVAKYVLYPYYNRQDFAGAYADKNKFQFFLPRMRFPTAIGKRVNARYYDTADNFYGETLTQAYVDAVYAAFLEACAGKTNEIIVKNSVGSMQGKGVIKRKIESKADLNALLAEDLSENFVIQIAVQQHPFFAQFNEDSVNIIRVTTWRTGGEVYTFAPCIRFGIKGFHTDVAFVNGTEIVNAVKINEDGTVAKRYVTMQGDQIDLPNEISGSVPQWEQLLACVKANALELPYFDIVAWDMTVDKDGDIVCIEYNLKFPGTVVYQYAHGPLAGGHTDELLSFLKEKQNVKLLPKPIRKIK